MAPGKTPRQSGGNRSGLVILALTLLPALAWYGYATTLMNSGSRASSDNVEVWRNVLIPRAWGRIRTYEVLWRYFVVRTFTPLALGLAVVGWWRGGIGRFWAGWVVGSMTMLLLLAAKLHHEYYWLWLSPGVAVGAGSLLVERLAGRAHPTRSDSLWMLRVPLVVLDQCSDSTGRGRPVALREKNRARIVAWGLLLGMSVWLTRSTWRTPAEWRGLEGAARRIEAQVPRDAGLIATEAVLYAADRKGYRLETEPESIRRALGEWGEAVPEQLATPERLVGWYHEHGARYLADVGDPDEGLRTGWVEAFREPPYRVLEDRPGLFLVTLPEDDDGDH